jgi:exonuclease III
MPPAPLSEPMKIDSFNINIINHRLANLLGWLREAEPDIMCLQELKATDTEFPAEVGVKLLIEAMRKA